MILIHTRVSRSHRVAPKNSRNELGTRICMPDAVVGLRSILTLSLLFLGRYATIKYYSTHHHTIILK